jgi:hypothetical protein
LYVDNEHLNLNRRKPLPDGEGLGWGQGGWFLVFFANEKLFNSLFFKIKSIIHPRFSPTLALPGGDGTQFPPIKSNLKKYISMLIA